MSPYRGPDRTRMAAQAERTVFQFAAQTAVWRQFVGTVGGNPVAGLGNVSRYRESTISAVFGRVHEPEMATPAGQVAAATVQCTTRERLGREDELRWRGVTYRVDSDAAPALIAGWWITTLRRGK